MSRFLRSSLSQFEVYTPGEQPQDRRYVKLNTNESPYPPSPEVIAALHAEEGEKLRLYSDPESNLLRQALAEAYGLGKENVFVSNGSDDILNFSFLAFAGEGVGAAYPDVTYGFYPVFSKLNHVDSAVIPLREDFTVCVEDYLGIGRMVVLANPNAPTGIALPRNEMEQIIRSNPDHVVLVDEAYVDFGGESCAQLVRRYDNLLVVMTYSKSRSMAGARLGFALGAKSLIDDLRRVQYSTNPYNVNRLTSACGIAALRSHAYYDEMCALICRTRKQAAEALQAMGFWVLPSSANFLFARTERLSGETIYRKLKDRGILVRHFDAPRIREYNRITIGTPEDMDALLSALREIL